MTCLLRGTQHIVVSVGARDYAPEHVALALPSITLGCARGHAAQRALGTVRDDLWRSLVEVKAVRNATRSRS
jgi:hypothetical protein